MNFWTPILIGFLGSVHCIGMCGPLVIALPAGKTGKSLFIFGRILYNAGRVFSYILLGAVFGIFGSGFVLLGLQQYLSIALGVLIIVYLILPGRYKPAITKISFVNKITSGLRRYFGRAISKGSLSSLILLGVINGFLPCGLVYTAIAGATGAGSTVNGMLFMFYFGLGTFPMMTGASLFGSFLNLNIRRRLTRLIPIFALLLAGIFILRGLNLGIPYLSPKFTTSAAVAKADCCKDN